MSSEPTLREAIAIMNTKIDQLLELKNDVKAISLQCPAHSVEIGKLTERVTAQEDIAKELRKDIDTIYNRLWAAVISIVLLGIGTLVGLVVKGTEMISQLKGISK